jgi:DNA-binding IclR family transcriptional regulator
MSSVQSIERAFAVLRRLASGPAGVTELAERVELPKSTVSRLLSTLEGIGAVEQMSVGGPYRIGPVMQEIVAAVSPGRSLVETARPHLVELTEATGEASGLAVADGNDVFYIDQVDSPSQVQVRDWTGERVPLHVVPSGLVLLANAPPERVKEYLTRPLARFTARTVTDAPALRKRLARVRDDGYAWVYEEFADGINSVAAPIVNGSGTVVAAVHSHGPAYRFPAEGRADDVAVQVQTVARRISLHLDARNDPGARSKRGS